MSSIFSYLLDMVYPRNCLGCDIALFEGEEVLCAECREELPFTGFFVNRENPALKKFYGRIKVENAGSAFFFTKDSSVQRMLFALKYERNKHVGHFMATLMAQEMLKCGWIKDVDLIVPLPLHKKKERLRGFNQAQVIAETLAELLHIPLNSTIIQRVVHSETQTHKTREERWASMQQVFKIRNADMLSKKHVLLVDDVLTTGATLEACGQEVLKISETKLSLATLAFTLQ